MLGLLFASPVELIVAWVVGAGCVLLLQREMPALRIVFNVALFGVTAGVAAVVFHALAAPAAQPRAGRWAAARPRPR